MKYLQVSPLVQFHCNEIVWQCNYSIAYAKNLEKMYFNRETLTPKNKNNANKIGYNC